MSTILHLLPGLSLILMALAATLVLGMCRDAGEADERMEELMAKLNEEERKAA